MKFGLSDKVIDEINGVFRKHSEVEKVLIFGSRVKGNYRPGSDIDLAVIGSGLDFRKLFKISESCSKSVAKSTTSNFCMAWI